MHILQKGVLFGVGEVFVMRGLLIRGDLQIERNLLGLKDTAGGDAHIDFSKSNGVRHFLEDMLEETLVCQGAVACGFILSTLPEAS